jgi:hypothetical protein
VIERVIENWLTSINERQFQLPFCQVLTAEGETVVQISSHGQLELGKDIVTIARDGIPNAYQLKAGTIRMTEWRKFKGEIDQLVEYPLDLPSVGSQHPHRPFLVTNGEINSVALNAILYANKSWKQRKFEQLRTINGSQLLARFKAAHGQYLPHEPLDLKMFLELYVRDGREPFAKAEFARFIESVLPLNHERRPNLEVQRAAGSIVLLTSYVLHDYEVRHNHWAIFEAWVVTASYVLAMATKFATPEKWWRKSLDLCLEATVRALQGLLRECEANSTQFVSLDLTDGNFYASRLSILAGLLGAYDLFRQAAHGDPPIEFVGRFLHKYLPDAKLWGESATPFLAIAALALESHGHQRNAEGLVFQLMSGIAKGNGSSRKGMPNPYYGPEESFRITAGLEPLNHESFQGLAYTLEPLVQFLARRWLRQSLKRVWDQMTRVYYASFRPAEEWEWLVWKARKGRLEFRQPGRPQSWARLLEEAAAPDSCGAPAILSSHPEAEDTKLCRSVALKFLPEGMGSDEAALDLATGAVIGQCQRRHRHQEYVRFLREIDANVPTRFAVHLIVDNYATHKHPRVLRWLAAHPRFQVHYTPTYASWLNQVEIWFNIITQQAIRRGTFRSVIGALVSRSTHSPELKEGV